MKYCKWELELMSGSQNTSNSDRLNSFHTKKLLWRQSNHYKANIILLSSKKQIYWSLTVIPSHFNLTCMFLKYLLWFILGLLKVYSKYSPEQVTKSRSGLQPCQLIRSDKAFMFSFVKRTDFRLLVLIWYEHFRNADLSSHQYFWQSFHSYIHR